MVRMARLGLAMAPTLSLKVLTNFRLSLVTSYERILTNFNKKVKRLMEEEKEEKTAKYFKNSLAAVKKILSL